MKQSSRRRVAWFCLLGLTFAQLAVASHVRASEVSRHAQSAAISGTAHQLPSTTDHCTTRLKPAFSNLCEAHCSDGASRLPVLALPMGTTAAALPVRVSGIVASPPAEKTRGHDEQTALSRAPPLVLQFCRFLI
jgi:hypothetical protein